MVDDASAVAESNVPVVSKSTEEALSDSFDGPERLPSMMLSLATDDSASVLPELVPTTDRFRS